MVRAIAHLAYQFLTACKAIAVDALCVVAFKWARDDDKRRSKVALIVLPLIWAFIMLTIFVPLFAVHADGVTFRGRFYPKYYGSAGYWCWIARPFVQKEAIGLLYIWMWVAVLVNSMIYVFLALVYRGNVQIWDGDRRERDGDRREVRWNRGGWAGGVQTGSEEQTRIRRTLSIMAKGLLL